MTIHYRSVSNFERYQSISKSIETHLHHVSFAPWISGAWLRSAFTFTVMQRRSS